MISKDGVSWVSAEIPNMSLKNGFTQGKKKEAGSGKKSSKSSKKKDKKKKKKKKPTVAKKKKNKKGYNPWDFSSGSTTPASSEQEDDNYDDIEDDDEELVFNVTSDHEFSPESETEDSSILPTQIKRARTVKKGDSAMNVVLVLLLFQRK